MEWLCHYHFIFGTNQQAKYYVFVRTNGPNTLYTAALLSDLNEFHLKGNKMRNGNYEMGFLLLWLHSLSFGQDVIATWMCIVRAFAFLYSAVAAVLVATVVITLPSIEMTLAKNPCHSLLESRWKLWNCNLIKWRSHANMFAIWPTKISNFECTSKFQHWLGISTG